jgi:hypothetical protein
MIHGAREDSNRRHTAFQKSVPLIHWCVRFCVMAASKSGTAGARGARATDVFLRSVALRALSFMRTRGA